jgi:hypothetical protein
MPKKQDEKIYEADFTETTTDTDAENEEETQQKTNMSLVLADSLKPLDPTSDTKPSTSVLKAVLIIIALTALLVLAGLYLRGLQLAAA